MLIVCDPATGRTQMRIFPYSVKYMPNKKLMARRGSVNKVTFKAYQKCVNSPLGERQAASNAKDAAQHPAMHRTALTTTYYPA